mgnify:FL=1
MNDPKLDYPNEFPVELTPPDISCYKNTNTGVDYVLSLDSGKSGPHVFISSIVHGNEPCGAIALDWFLKNNLRPKSGKLTLGFMNVEAYFAFDPKNPNRTRWVDEDFNRLWAEGVLEDATRKKTSEFLRANEVKSIISEADYLLDIHSMQKPCVPLMMAGMLVKGVEFAKSVDMSMPIISDTGHKEGMRMRDYLGFSRKESTKNALLVECGQHWEKLSEKIAIETMIRFLRSTGTVDKEFGEEFINELSPPKFEKEVYRVGEIITIKTDNFKFSSDWQGFEVLKKGTVIGQDDEKVINAPYEETILIMPTKRLFRGKTAVRLAYRYKD